MTHLTPTCPAPHRATSNPEAHGSSNPSRRRRCRHTAFLFGCSSPPAAATHPYPPVVGRRRHLVQRFQTRAAARPPKRQRRPRPAVPDPRSRALLGARHAPVAHHHRSTVPPGAGGHDERRIIQPSRVHAFRRPDARSKVQVVRRSTRCFFFFLDLSICHVVCCCCECATDSVNRP